MAVEVAQSQFFSFEEVVEVVNMQVKYNQHSLWTE